MRIGIISDIHDAVQPLSRALALLRDRGADQFVVLGDTFETFEPGEAGPEIARLLRGVGAIGVWGNHDFGLCREVPPEVRGRADPDLLAFTAGLMPHLVLEGVRFAHIESWLDPCRLMDLWYFDGIPDNPERAERSFQAAAERIHFIGHFHTPLVVHRNGLIPWEEGTAVRLAEPDRFLVVVPPVLRGWCAEFDTIGSELTMIRCGDG